MDFQAPSEICWIRNSWEWGPRNAVLTRPPPPDQCSHPWLHVRIIPSARSSNVQSSLVIPVCCQCWDIALKSVYKSPEGSEDLGWDPSVWISNKLPGDPIIAGKHVQYKAANSYIKFCEQLWRFCSSHFCTSDNLDCISESLRYLKKNPWSFRFRSPGLILKRL